MKRLFLSVLAAVALFGASTSASAQARFQYLGPNECLNCHDHEAEKQWYQKQEAPEVQKLFPQKGGNAGHINGLKQLEGAKSNDFAKAIGLKDKYDIKGSCVRCHGTVFQGDANAGVSCESCHGPASGYLKPHQTKGAYSASLAVGMVDLVGKIPAWVQQCTSCHIVQDQKLVGAGHPSGDDFTGAKYAPVALHFKKKYGAADVNAVFQQMIAKAKGGAAPTAPPPAAAPTPLPVAVPPAPPAASPSAAPTTAAAVPPVRAPEPSRAPAPAAPAPTTRPPAAARAPVAPATPPAAAPSAASAAPPVDLTPPPPPPAAAAPPVAVALPTSLSSALALVQGRLIVALTAALQGGSTAPTRTSTPPPALAPYAGPDADLLQLQREAIALAIEALGSPAAAPAK